MCFFDISHVGPAHPDTIAEAKKQNQIAVFDLANFNEIPTGLERSRDVTSAWGNPFNRQPQQPMHDEGWNRFKAIMDAAQLHGSDPRSMYLRADREGQGLSDWLSPTPVEGRRPYIDAQSYTPEELNQYHRRYQDEALQHYKQDPSSPYFDYENFIDWYGTYHPERLGSAKTGASNPDLHAQRT
jgi:hypothetical protein